jgi:hypothetical protein
MYQHCNSIRQPELVSGSHSKKIAFNLMRFRNKFGMTVNHTDYRHSDI